MCVGKNTDQHQNTRKMDTTKEVQFRLSLNGYRLPQDAECKHILFYSSEFHITCNIATWQTDHSNATRKLIMPLGFTSSLAKLTFLKRHCFQIK